MTSEWLNQMIQNKVLDDDNSSINTVTVAEEMENLDENFHIDVDICDGVVDKLLPEYLCAGDIVRLYNCTIMKHLLHPL